MTDDTARFKEIEDAYERHGYSTEGRTVLRMVDDQLEATDALHDVIKELRAERDRLREWAREAKSLLNLSRIAIEHYGDKTGLLAANLRTFLATYPGEEE